MEMIDVLNRLKEIQESRPGVVDDAVASVESFNPKTEGAVKGMVMDMEQDAVEMSKEEFIKKHGSSNSVMDIWNKVQKEKAEVGESKHMKKSMAEDITNNGKDFLMKAGFDPMKVQAYIAVFNDHGDTSDIDQMNMEKVGLADAMSMVLASHDIENESTTNESPYTSDKIGAGFIMANKDKIIQQLYAGGVQSVLDPKDAIKAISDLIPDVTEQEIMNILKKENVKEAAKPDFLDIDGDGDKKEPMKKAIKDKETMKEEDAYDNDRFQIKAGRAIKDNSGTADKKDHVYAPDAKTALKLHGLGKKVYKEAIQISTDSPEEATMIMRMLQMAGVRPMDQDMINQPAQQGGCGTDEAYANEPDIKIQDTDTLVNFHSGGLNRQKRTFPKVAGGDNPMQKTESLADSLRTQYAEFKANYQTAVTEAKKSKSPYAVGMAQAMKSTGDKPPLKKATIKKAHDIAKAVKKGK